MRCSASSIRQEHSRPGGILGREEPNVRKSIPCGLLTPQWPSRAAAQPGAWTRRPDRHARLFTPPLRPPPQPRRTRTSAGACADALKRRYERITLHPLTLLAEHPPTTNSRSPPAWPPAAPSPERHTGAKVDKVVTLATPFQASYEAVLKVATDTADFGDDSGKARERRMARLTRALYHLLPSFAGLDTHDDDGLPTDLFPPHRLAAQRGKLHRSPGPRLGHRRDSLREHLGAPAARRDGVGPAVEAAETEELSLRVCGRGSGSVFVGAGAGDDGRTGGGKRTRCRRPPCPRGSRPP